jgi:hypothetical protein
VHDPLKEGLKQGLPFRYYTSLSVVEVHDPSKEGLKPGFGIFF